eukprot:EG_transcript_29153
MPEVHLRFILAGAVTAKFSGSAVEFALDNEHTVAQAKEQIIAQLPREYKDIGIEKKKLNLLHCGQVLDDKATLLSYGLHPTDSPMTLHLMLQSHFDDASAEKEEDAKPEKNTCCIIA